jgi:hypothetical protein
MDRNGESPSATYHRNKKVTVVDVIWISDLVLVWNLVLGIWNFGNGVGDPGGT